VGFRQRELDAGFDSRREQATLVTGRAELDVGIVRALRQGILVPALRLIARPVGRADEARRRQYQHDHDDAE
jgi:hypothetical protein